jgi:hypothetical protein
MLHKYNFMLLIAMLCLAFITLSVEAQDVPENILQNSDFENVGNAPWTMWVEDPAAMAIKACL